MAGVTIGVDIGGTKTQWMVFDEQLQLLDSHYEATPKVDRDAWLAWLQQLLAPVLARYPVQGIGLALPGIFAADHSLQAVNLPSVHGRVTADTLAALWPVPVVTGNDCRMAALGEARLGAGQGAQRVLSVRLGTGLGAGLCLQGQLYHGAQQQSCELGHQAISAAVLHQWQLPVWPCQCGQRGCTEQYASGHGLLQLLQHFSGASSPCTVADWQRAFANAEPAAQQTLDCWLDCVASVLVNQVLAFDPDVLVLSGGVFAGEIQISAVIKRTQQRFIAGWRLPPLVPATLANSTCVGAALEAMQQPSSTAR